MINLLQHIDVKIVFILICMINLLQHIDVKIVFYSNLHD